MVAKLLRKLLIVALLFVALFPSTIHAQIPLGTHSSWSVVANSNCPAGSPSVVPTNECAETTITCPSISNETIRTKYSAATASPHKGVIVLGTGGDGRGWYEAYAESTRSTLLNPLLGEGFDVIQVAYGPATGQVGWLTGQAPNGLLDLACRWATAVDAIYTRYHVTAEPYCVSGQSGGAGGLSYSLAQYGLETILDEALVSGGPPFARIDYGCIGPPNDSTWAAACTANKNPSCGTWESVCEYTSGSEALINGSYSGGGTPCSGTSPNATQAQRDIWHEDSVLSSTSDLDYPNTRVDFLYGGAECGIECSGGRLYRSAITSDKSDNIVIGATHTQIPTTGAGQLFATLRDQCVFRHQPPPDAGPPDTGIHDDAEPLDDGVHPDADPEDSGVHPDAEPACNCCAQCQ